MGVMVLNRTSAWLVSIRINLDHEHGFAFCLPEIETQSDEYRVQNPDANDHKIFGLVVFTMIWLEHKNSQQCEDRPHDRNQSEQMRVPLKGYFPSGSLTFRFIQFAHAIIQLKSKGLICRG